LVKQQGVPPNYARREAQLVEQLSELSTALKTKEASATQRVAAASAELQRKLNLIDETKDQQLAVLQTQLKRLRTARERLEREVAEQNGE
jgi:flagellar motility protein MotE (MotC chaperone)